VSGPKPRRLYLVQERNWEPDPDAGELVYANGPDDDASPVKAFADLSRADAFCRERERERRERVNPFEHGRKLSDLTHFDAGRLCDWLLDAGLDPPGPKVRIVGWRKWWADTRRGLSDYQRAKVWEALDRVRFFEVVELDGPE